MSEIAPIRKVFRIINSCVNEKQLRTCEKLSDFYVDMIKRKGVVNSFLVKEVLYIKINEKREELKLAHKFKGKIRRRKIKIKEVEHELIENFS